MTVGEGDRPIAIVTGGSRGLGLALAQNLLTQHYKVIVLSRTAPPPDFSGKHIATDITDVSSVMGAFNQIRQIAGRVEVLINNAAKLHSQYLMILPAESIATMVTTNLMGSILVARETTKLMRKHRFGRLVHISSMAAVLKPVGDSAYAATKAGLEVFSSALAKEVFPLGITSNVLSISAYDSEMYRSLNLERVGEVVRALPVPGLASIDDIMNALKFFLLDSSGGITGQSLRLGGVS